MMKMRHQRIDRLEELCDIQANLLADIVTMLRPFLKDDQVNHLDKCLMDLVKRRRGMNIRGLERNQDA